MSEKRVIIPGSYAKISYEIRTEDDQLIESTKSKEKKDDTEIEIDRPIIVKQGNKEILFDDELLNIPENEEKEIILPPEKGFGKRDPKKVESIPLKKLRAMIGRRNIQVGDVLYTENRGYYGTVKYIGSRDVLIDRNHPFAGKKLIVKLKVHKIIYPTDPPEEKLKFIAERYFGSDIAEKFGFKLAGDQLLVQVPSEILMDLNVRELLRKIYAPRKDFVNELFAELNLKKIEFKEEFLIGRPEIKLPSIKSETEPIITKEKVEVVEEKNIKENQDVPEAENK